MERRIRILVKAKTSDDQQTSNKKAKAAADAVSRATQDPLNRPSHKLRPCKREKLGSVYKNDWVKCPLDHYF